MPAGETAKTAVVFNGDVLIDGTVSETLVVFNGRTEITGTIGEDVVVFNGSVLRSGARVGGDVVSRQTPQIEDGATVDGSIDDLQKRWDYWDITFVGRLGWWLAYTVSTLVLGLVLLMLARGLDPASIRALRDRLGATIGFGLLWFVLLPIVAVLLLVTIVGIPLGLFLLFGLGLVYSIGYVVGGLALGRLVVKEPTSRYLAFLAGWALRVLALVPFLGGIAWPWGRCSGLGRFGSPHGHRAGIGRSGSPSRRAPSAKRSRLAAPLQVERGWALSTDPISLRPFRGRSHTDAC